MKLKKIAAKIFPVAKVIATAFGTPFSGMALDVVGKALGCEPKADAITKAIDADPEAMAKIKVADADLDRQLKELDVDIFALEVDDRQDARDMARVNMMPQIVLAAAYNVSYFYMMFMLLSGTWTLPAGSEGQLIAGLIGVLTAALKDINQFWFGSSFGSKNKVSR